MADLKEGVFADDASQHYGSSALPTHPSVFSHELSPRRPAQPARPAPQKRQFLRPGLNVPVEPSMDTFQPIMPVEPLPSLQPGQALPVGQSGQEQPRRQFAPKFSLPAYSADRLPVSPTQATATVASPYALAPLPVLVPPAPTELPVQEPQKASKPQRKRKQKKPKKKMTRGRVIRRIMVVCSILTIIAVIFASQANGASGAWTADMLRAVLGPTITARIESWYLGLSDTTHQIQYKLSGQQVVPPWSVGVSPVVTTTPPPKVVQLSPMPLNRITPVISPALAGEGQWAVQSAAPAPYSYLPLDARAFIRPDPSHPYAIVTLLQFDARFFRLHMVAGTVEPGGPRGYYGSGVIPSADQKGNALLAAFNGGFKYADGQYGLKTGGIVYVPPQPNAATIAVTKSGQILLGTWGVDSRLNSNNTDLIAWRQNAALLINNGTINPLTQDGAAWGGTILNSAYTWRSGIGLTANGTLIYAAGSSLTALTLGEALKAAGAVMAMQTDINPFWVRAFLYNRNAQGTYDIIKLNPAMYGTGTEYLSATQRDFFYLTRFAPPPPPPVVHPREAPPQ